MITQPFELGKRVPIFALPVAIGGRFGLESALERGPVVLSFIRGVWCEFCTEHLEIIQKWKTSLKNNSKTLS